MSYADIADMRESISLSRRLIACAAQEGHAADPGPGPWVHERIWTLVTSPGWPEAWAYAADTADPAADPAPDIGANEGVISDGMILAAVASIT